ncbi:Ankyrin repeat and FYVE domain-containing protein 1 [Desmophyllum pertusum]|uniref:Ankyrin repeat and FYVE domain-containing protein 1 n=1 Tax=Desmophyllum pertusum TaxID=174260 RepID=A0A9X0CS72_9CNID|nr:Ankyrin repeat and FYVE domain-containing protein 1 [Desmophyllum pertusum]
MGGAHEWTTRCRRHPGFVRLRHRRVESGPNGCTQSLLHRAIDERDELSACFLIRSGCDINSPRRPGPDGEGGVEAWDGMTPLHLACEAGLDVVVQTLVEHKVNVNSKDSESRSPIHIAITSKTSYRHQATAQSSGT